MEVQLRIRRYNPELDEPHWEVYALEAEPSESFKKGSRPCRIYKKTPSLTQ